MADPMDNRDEEEKEADRAMAKSAQMIGNAIIDGIAAYWSGKDPDGDGPGSAPAAASAEVDPDDKPPSQAPAAAHAEVDYGDRDSFGPTRSNLGPDEMYSAQDLRDLHEEQAAREAAEERQAGPENEKDQGQQEHDWREPIFSDEERQEERQRVQAFEEQHGERVQELGEHQDGRYGPTEERTATKKGMAKGELNELQGRDIKVYGPAAAAGQAIDLGHVDEAEYKSIAQKANTEYAEAFEGTEIEKEAHAEMEKAGLSTGKGAVEEEDEDHGRSNASENDQDDEMSWEDQLDADLAAAAGDDMGMDDMGEGMEEGAEAGETVEVAGEAAEAEMVMTV